MRKFITWDGVQNADESSHLKWKDNEMKQTFWKDAGKKWEGNESTLLQKKICETQEKAERREGGTNKTAIVIKFYL